MKNIITLIIIQISLTAMGQDFILEENGKTKYLVPQDMKESIKIESYCKRHLISQTEISLLSRPVIYSTLMGIKIKKPDISIPTCRKGDYHEIG